MKIFYKIYEKLLTYYYICTMDFDYTDYMLKDDVQNAGRKFYIVGTMTMFMLTFVSVFGFNGHFISYLAVFVLSGLFAIMAQARNYYFNDLTIGLVYRVLLLFSVLYIGNQLMFTDFDQNLRVSNDALPSEWKFFYKATPIMFALYTLIGAALSFPFKMIAYAAGTLRDDFYVENREVEYDEYVPQSKVKSMLSKYDSYNESELEAMKIQAEKNEDYEEARRIALYIERKF